MRVFLVALGSWVAQALVVPSGDKKADVTFTKKKVQKAQRELPTLASSLAALSHHRGYVSQDPPAAEAEAPPAETVSHEVDKEGYEADWGTEHSSEPYPESSRGKQHHPSYHTTTRFEAYVGLAWYYILAILALIGAIAYGAFTYLKK